MPFDGRSFPVLTKQITTGDFCIPTKLSGESNLLFLEQLSYLFSSNKVKCFLNENSHLTVVARYNELFKAKKHFGKPVNICVA